MPKIILQASTFQKNYDITTVVVSPEEYEKSTTVFMDIKPHDGFTIDAKNFYSGFLSSKISNVNYENTVKELGVNNNVRVSVVLKNNLLSEGSNNVIIIVPVNGFAEVPSNILEFVDNTTYGENLQVINKIGSVTRVSGSVNGSTHVNTYSAVGRKNESGVLLEKTFIANDGYYFKVSPLWTMSSIRRKNFTITSVEVKDDKKRIIQKIYTLSYKFPNKTTTTKALDKISFSADVILVKKERVTKTTADKIEEHKIHSFQVFPSVSGRDKRKRFAVRGVPGTPFNILVQDQDKKIYNFKTGQFAEGGPMFSGVIPPGDRGRTQGVYKGIIKTQTQSEISARLMTHEKDPSKGTRVITQKIDKAYTASVIANNTGITGPTLSTSTILSDKILPSNIATVSFSFIVTAGTGRWLYLNRKPFTDISKDFNIWATGTDDLVDDEKLWTGAADTSTLIENDFDITSGGASDTLRASSFNISNVVVTPVNFAPVELSGGESTDLVGFKSYSISGYLNVTTIGEENLVVQLRLNNFLSELPAT